MKFPVVVESLDTIKKKLRQDPESEVSGCKLNDPRLKSYAQFCRKIQEKARAEKVSTTKQYDALVQRECDQAGIYDDPFACIKNKKVVVQTEAHICKRLKKQQPGLTPKGLKALASFIRDAQKYALQDGIDNMKDYRNYLVIVFKMLRAEEKKFHAKAKKKNGKAKKSKKSVKKKSTKKKKSSKKKKKASRKSAKKSAKKTTRKSSRKARKNKGARKVRKSGKRK